MELARHKTQLTHTGDAVKGRQYCDVMVRHRGEELGLCLLREVGQAVEQDGGHAPGSH